MLAALQRRARKQGLAGRIETRLAEEASLGVDDLAGTIDFVLAFAMVHELPDSASFLAESHRALRPGRKLLIAEPKGHVTKAEFAGLVDAATKAGFSVEEGPAIARCWTAVLTRI